MNIIRPTFEQIREHRLKGKHRKENPLRDIILGGQDGLVNALGIILGVSVATADVRILIATVLAATCAESVSMGVVAYTADLSQRDYYISERRKEEREIELDPSIEKEEIREIYEQRGFKGKILEEIVQTITSDKKLWVDTMMREELDIHPINIKLVLKSAIIVTITTAIGHLIPLVPFFFVSHNLALIISVIFSAIALFAVGAYEALSLTGKWWKSGIRMVLIGLIAVFLGFLIAKLFHAVG